MKLGELTGNPSDTVEVRRLCFDSRQVQEGDAFFAIRGHQADGHKYLAEVAAKKPAVLVVEDSYAVPKDFKGRVVTVTNTRSALDEWSAKFFHKPAEKLFCAGVTGTNGKTTSVYMIEKVLGEAGWLTGVIGTIDHHIGKHTWETSNTTPDPVTLQSRLSEFLQNGARAAALEVTNVALDQDRASSVPYNAAIFTNFTRDHLDYHGTMEKYFEAKEKLFADVLARSTKSDVYAVLNIDDEHVAKVRVAKRARRITFGTGVADYRFRVTKEALAGSEFMISFKNKETTVMLATPGRHNVYNAVGVFVLAVEAGISPETVAKAFARFTGAPGRLQSVPNKKGLHIFVDYAHTDDALRSVLLSIRNLMLEAKSNGELWTIFGCGGDRDRGKRPLMAKAAVENSDHVVITSDNPRTEDPEAIIRDCVAGVQEAKVATEADRKKAISYVLQRAKEGDVILIAGKGHENCQIIGQTKYPFSDVAVVEELLI